MPDFQEIFETKERRDLFTQDVAALVRCNTSIEDARRLLLQSLKSLKALCEVVQPHQTIDDATAAVGLSFRAAYGNSDLFPEFLREVEALIRAVNRDVESFLADGATPFDVEQREREYSEREVELIREKARQIERSGSFLEQKELEERQRMEEEIQAFNRLRQKEKELLTKDAPKPLVKAATSPNIAQSGGLKTQAFSASTPQLVEKKAADPQPKPQRRSAAEVVLKDLEEIKSTTTATKTPAATTTSSSIGGGGVTKTLPRSVTEPNKSASGHNFTETTVNMPIKCKFCFDHILFGKALKCEACQSIIHRKCETPQNLGRNGCRERF